MMFYKSFPGLVLILLLAVSPRPAMAQFNAFKDPAAVQQGSVGADFRAVVEDIKGGKIAVGATAYVVVLFKNQGPTSITVGKVALYPSSTVSAEVSLNQCADAPLTTDAQCAITVAVKGQQSGAWRVEMLTDHDGRARVATASMSGDVELLAVKSEEKGDLDVSASSLDFGTSAGGSGLVKSLVLNNRSAQEIKIKGVMMDVPDQSGFSYKSQCPETLQPQETCNIIVTWLPTARGLVQGVLAVQHTGPSGMTQTELKGVLEPEVATQTMDNTDVSIAPENLDFGSSPGGIALVKSVVVSNFSDAGIAIKNVTLDVSEKSGFSYKSQCPEMLQPQEACNLIVTWMPTTKGLAQGVLAVRHSGRSGLAQVEVKGVLQPGTVTNAALYPESVPDTGLLISDKEVIDFGLGIKEEAATTISLVNAGSADLTIEDVSLAGMESGLAVLDLGCDNGIVLKPGAACPLSLSWLPIRTGMLIDSLQIFHTGARGILIIPVRGSADSIKKVLPPPPPPPVAFEKTSPVTKNNDEPSKAPQQAVAPEIIAALNNYTVTSHSQTRAVINGPAGGLVVRDGEDVVIEGVKWTVAIISTGVVLTNKKSEATLSFDRSLKSLLPAAQKTGGAAAEEGVASTLPPTIGGLQMINP